MRSEAVHEAIITLQQGFERLLRRHFILGISRRGGSAEYDRHGEKTGEAKEEGDTR